jgi:hypothetical protein
MAPLCVGDRVRKTKPPRSHHGIVQEIKPDGTIVIFRVNVQSKVSFVGNKNLNSNTLPAASLLTTITPKWAFADETLRVELNPATVDDWEVCTKETTSY